MTLLKDIWTKIRPFFVILVVDAFITIFMWILLWTFKLITSYLSVENWVSIWINNIHSIGFILTYVTFGILFINDIFRFSIKNESNNREDG